MVFEIDRSKFSIYAEDSVNDQSSLKPKVEILPSESEYSITFCIWREDHTLGNVLRHVIMKNPEVTFCGYSIPHPSEFKIHLRIQTTTNTTAFHAFKKGLSDVKMYSRIIMEKFDTAYEEFEQVLVPNL